GYLERWRVRDALERGVAAVGEVEEEQDQNQEHEARDRHLARSGDRPGPPGLDAGDRGDHSDRDRQTEPEEPGHRGARRETRDVRREITFAPSSRRRTSSALPSSLRPTARATSIRVPAAPTRTGSRAAFPSSGSARSRSTSTRRETR